MYGASVRIGDPQAIRKKKKKKKSCYAILS